MTVAVELVGEEVTALVALDDVVRALAVIAKANVTLSPGRPSGKPVGLTHLERWRRGRGRSRGGSRALNIIMRG